MLDVRHRFPGVKDGWARFDGPAGTQALDAAIDAMSDWQRSGNNANEHGPFAAADACDELVDRARSTMGRLLGADGAGMMFGPSTTNNIMVLTRSIAQTLQPGDEIVCTRLDHDSNIAPWLLAARDSGATVRLADFDTATGRLATEAVGELFTERTRWVAVTGASNVFGVMPDVTAITAAAHDAGARVVVDGVHLTPHAAVDIGKIGCDVYSTSSYKWYGPHAAVTWIEPSLIASLEPYKVRPASDHGPDRFQLGTPSFEAIAGLTTAAEWLMDVGLATLAGAERAVFARLLDGLLAIDGVRIIGPHDLVDRTPTLAFLIDGRSPLDLAIALATDRIAVWDGHNYAIEAMAALGLGDRGAVRAGVVAYSTDEDVDRLLAAIEKLATSAG